MTSCVWLLAEVCVKSVCACACVYIDIIEMTLSFSFMQICLLIKGIENTLPFKLYQKVGGDTVLVFVCFLVFVPLRSDTVTYQQQPLVSLP